MFFLGIAAAFGALLFELAVLNIFFDRETLAPDFFYQITFFLSITVFIEEAAKTYFIFRYIIAANNSAGFFRNSLIFGVGFSFVEVFFLHFAELSSPNYLYLQLAGVALIHTATSGFIGYALAKFKTNSQISLLFAIIPAFLIHFFYNMAIIRLAPLQ